MMFEKEDRKTRSMSQVGLPNEEQCRDILSIPSCPPLQHNKTNRQAISPCLTNSTYNYRSKAKVSLECTGGVEGKIHVLYTSTLDGEERSAHLHGNNHQYILDRRLCDPEGRSVCGGEEKNSCPCLISKPELPSP
jgi:hypothetical protein